GTFFGESSVQSQGSLHIEGTDAVTSFLLKTPIIIDDTRQSPFVGADRFGARGILSLVAVPLQISDRLWGTLTIGFPTVHAATGDRVDFLTAIASHLGVAIKNAELYTEAQSAYEELRETQRRVVQQERLRALGQMASGIAHDLNNALVPALGFTELLLERPHELGDARKVQEYLHLIHTGAQDAASVVSRLR